MNENSIHEREIYFTAQSPQLAGTLTLPDGARGAVLFAHGTGSSRHSPRNRYVARMLNDAGVATFLIDLLTADEETAEMRGAQVRFDVALLATRFGSATDWLVDHTQAALPIGYFGASTGAAAALIAAAERLDVIKAVVSRGGRPDLAGAALPRVQAPTLLIVGGEDKHVIDLNKEALTQLHTVKELAIINGATHLFEEPGALEEVTRLACDWFARYL